MINNECVNNPNSNRQRVNRRQPGRGIVRINPRKAIGGNHDGTTKTRGVSRHHRRYTHLPGPNHTKFWGRNRVKVNLLRVHRRFPRALVLVINNNRRVTAPRVRMLRLNRPDPALLRRRHRRLNGIDHTIFARRVNVRPNSMI